MAGKPARVLFVCVGNAGRSQMAEAFFNRAAGGWAVAESAGTRPAARVSSTVIAVMKEVGVDLTGCRTKPLTPDMLSRASRVITMGCGVQEACPASRTIAQDWGLADPRDQPVERVREIRDEIRRRVDSLIGELGIKTQGELP
jgi:arsenate reductase